MLTSPHKLDELHIHDYFSSGLNLRRYCVEVPTYICLEEGHIDLKPICTEGTSFQLDGSSALLDSIKIQLQISVLNNSPV